MDSDFAASHKVLRNKVGAKKYHNSEGFWNQCNVISCTFLWLLNWYLHFLTMKDAFITLSLKNYERNTLALK